MIYPYLTGIYKPTYNWRQYITAPLCHLVQHHVFDHSDARVWGPALHAVIPPIYGQIVDGLWPCFTRIQNDLSKKATPNQNQVWAAKKNCEKGLFRFPDSLLQKDRKVPCFKARDGTSHGYFGRYDKYDTLLSHHGAKHTKIANVILQVESSGMVDWL